MCLASSPCRGLLDGGIAVFGGGPNDTNHTRIIDLAWPDGESPTQEEMLSAYTGVNAALGQLTADDFPQIQMFVAK